MNYKAILFDLDGTLLPMDQHTFEQTYLKMLAAYLAPYGYEPKALIDAIWKGTGAMLKNDGSRTNEAAFWDTFAAILGEQVLADIPHFDRFYRTDFNKVQAISTPDKTALALVKRIRAAGIPMAIATNPVFPAVATENRMRWAGLDAEDFALYTTYETSRFCKPNAGYYREVCAALGVDPAECLMVGNDVIDDGSAAALGMDVFLVTDHLLNPNGDDLSAIPHGTFADLTKFLNI